MAREKLASLFSKARNTMIQMEPTAMKPDQL